MKIRYMLLQNGNNVCFTILDMDERFRCRPDGSTITFMNSHGFSISSYSNTELRNKKVYLRGKNKNKDYDFSFIKLDSYEDAKEYIKNVHRALEEWAEKWEGWASPEEYNNDEYCNIVDL